MVISLHLAWHAPGCAGVLTVCLYSFLELASPSRFVLAVSRAFSAVAQYYAMVAAHMHVLYLWCSPAGVPKQPNSMLLCFSQASSPDALASANWTYAVLYLWCPPTGVPKLPKFLLSLLPEPAQQLERGLESVSDTVRWWLPFSSSPEATPSLSQPLPRAVLEGSGKGSDQAARLAVSRVCGG